MEARAPGLKEGQARSEGIASLVREFDSPLRRFFTRRVADKADVPDLLQEVFIRLSRMTDTLRIDRRDRFIFVVANNVLRDVTPAFHPAATRD